MATHFSILAWRIPWTEDPGGLQSMGSQRVRHNSMTSSTALHINTKVMELSFQIILKHLLYWASQVAQ